MEVHGVLGTVTQARGKPQCSKSVWIRLLLTSLPESSSDIDEYHTLRTIALVNHWTNSVGGVAPGFYQRTGSNQY